MADEAGKTNGTEKIAKASKALAQSGRDPFMDGSGGWGVPIMTQDMTFKDIGSYGLRQYSGWVREEFLPQLVGRQAARVYREMLDNSTVVGSINFAITQLMREIVWRTEAPSDRPEAKAEEEFAESLRHDMSHTWEDFLAEALSMIGYGYAPHEIIYKRRNGRQPADSGKPTSIYDDGRIGIRRLPIRGQDTVLKWFFDENGQIKGMTQQPWVGQLIDIPIEKMLLFRPTAHKNNPEGRSVLRNAYRPYYFIKRLEEQEAIMFERFGGLPVLYVPNALLEGVAAGDANAVASFNMYKKIVANVRVDEQMGLILPSDTYSGATGPSSVRMYEFQLITPGGSGGGGGGSRSGGRGGPMGMAIERYKLEILTTVLADFIAMGHNMRGAQNLGETKSDMFYAAIEGWLNSIGGVLNRYLLPRVWNLNGLDYDVMPEYKPDMAQRPDMDALGSFVLRLSQAGMPLFPDEDLENYIRDAGGLPDIADEGVHAKAVAAAAAEKQTTPTEITKRILQASMARRVRQQRAA